MRFFRHLVDEHRAHPYPQLRDSVWANEDAGYMDHLEKAEAELAVLEAAEPTNIEPFPQVLRPSMENQESHGPNG